MGSYLDTSFLVKLYIREKESDEVAAFISTRRVLFISPVVELEIASTLYRTLGPLKGAERYQDLLRDEAAMGFIRCEVDESVFSLARSLASLYWQAPWLRSLDALHLATAIHHGAAELATFDRRLADAAERVGLNVVPTRS